MPGASKKLVRRRSLASRVTILVLVAVAASLILPPVGTAGATTETLYLKGDGVPNGSLSYSPPTGSLPNFDPDRDDFPGLELKKSKDLRTEDDPKKYQQWIGEPTGMVLEGTVSLTIWSSIKDFNIDKKGLLRAYLLDCDATGSDCKRIKRAKKSADPWASFSQTWIQSTLSFGTVSYTIPEGRSLVLKIVVDEDSDDEMWIAYDAAAYPSSLTVTTPPPPTTTTTTTAAPTTTSPPTTTTAAPPAPTTTTTKPPAVTTTTRPPTTTTRPPTTTTRPPVSSAAPPTTTVAPAPPPDESGPTTTPATDTDFAATSPPATLPAGDLAMEEDPVVDEDPIPDEDMAMSPLPTNGDTDGEQPNLSGVLIDDLELVIPPAVATTLLSPLLLVESIVSAFWRTGRDLLIPGLLLLVGVLWTDTQRKRDLPILDDANGDASA